MKNMKNIKKSDSSSVSKKKEKLSEIGNQYLEFLELARDVISTLSPEGLVISLSRAFENITGWQPNEWIGKPFESFTNYYLLPTSYCLLLTADLSKKSVFPLCSKNLTRNIFGKPN
jgi:PAS domain-containing protein